MTIWNDLRYATRSLARKRTSTLVVLASMALGAGANAAIFAMTNAALFRPLPYPGSDHLIVTYFTEPNRPAGRPGATISDCRAVQRNNGSLGEVGCTRDIAMSWSDPEADSEAPLFVPGQQFTAGFPRALGTSPLLGRWFVEAEESPDANRVVVISHELWQSRYGGMSDILGRLVRIDRELATVIGIMPKGFEFHPAQIIGPGFAERPSSQFWIPFSRTPAESSRSQRSWTAVGRLRQGLSIEEAQLEFDGLRIPADNGESAAERGLKLVPLREFYFGSAENALLLLQGMVLFVLVIACANIGSLVAYQGMAMKREIAIRSALGGTRTSIVRQLLTQGALLSLLGSILGLVIAAWLAPWLGLLLLPGVFSSAESIATDSRVVGFTLLAGVAIGLAFGIAPAIQASRRDLRKVLGQFSQLGREGFTRPDFRRVFVVVQIALAFMMVIAAGLMLNTLIRLNAVEIGIDPSGLSTLQMPLSRQSIAASPTEGTPNEHGSDSLFLAEQLRDRLAQTSGVQFATIAAHVPFSGSARTLGIRTDSATTELRAQWYAIGNDYFEALGVPILVGNGFQLRESSTPVAIVNSTLAMRLWSGQNPIGQMVQVDLTGDLQRRVVGIVADTRQSNRASFQPQIFVPIEQVPERALGQATRPTHTITFIIRSSITEIQLATSVRSALASLDPTWPIFNIKSVDQYLSDQLLNDKRTAGLLGAFGGITMFLALVGTYGLMSQSLAERTPEIGIRIALGASPMAVLRLAIRQWVVISALGLLLGLSLSIAFTRVIESALWNVSAVDPTTYVVVTIGFLTTSMFACSMPVLRALSMDPLASLRHE